MRYLSRAQYENVLRSVLSKQGLTPEQAESLIAARFPVPGVGVLAELFGRGLSASPDDINAFLDWYRGVHPEIPAEINVTNTAFDAWLVDQMAAWLVESGRAQPTLASQLMDADFEPAKRIIEEGQSCSRN